jgi:competence protein ComEC
VTPPRHPRRAAPRRETLRRPAVLPAVVSRPAGVLLALSLGLGTFGCTAPGTGLPASGTPDLAPPPGLLSLHFLDVGQGDAVLIEAPTGQHVLIDAGPSEEVVETLRSLGVESLDLFIVSHNHADHIGGAAEVLRSFPVRFFLDSGIPHTTLTYQRMLEALEESEVPVLDPEYRAIDIGPVLLTILPPPGDPDLGHNDNSVGVTLSFGAFRASFAGDAEGRLWRHWLSAHPEDLAPVDVHKASHHGSRNGDIPEAMERLRPTLVVISAGGENRYGHPHPEALELYRRAGAEVQVTAGSGPVRIRARGDGSFRVEGGRRLHPLPAEARSWILFPFPFSVSRPSPGGGSPALTPGDGKP